MGPVIFILGMAFVILGIFAGIGAAITYFFDKSEGSLLVTVAISCVASGGIIGFIGFVIIYVSTMLA